jgi:putative nucleotidyltransferase with HDIG domain
MRKDEKTYHQEIVKHLQQVAHSLRNRQAYLVGGSVRNLLLHEPCVDWDIVIDGDVVSTAKQIANTLGGHFVHMHDKASRIVVKEDLHEWIFDLSPLQGDSIEADLHTRDFTLNALAIPLADILDHLTQGEDLAPIDPLNGANDLASKQLRMVHDRVFQIDPLRMLRAVRFMRRYQLTLEAHTEQALKRDAPFLLQVAPERIREELYTILQPQGATDVLRLLDKLHLLTTLIPEFLPARGMPQPGLHHWDVLEHSLEAVAALEELTRILQQDATESGYNNRRDGACPHPHPSPNNRRDGACPRPHPSEGHLYEIQQLLLEAQQQELFQFASLQTPVVKLGALLHDIGKTVTYAVDDDGNITFYHHPQAGVPLAQQVMQRIHASTQERRLVQQIVAHHMRPGQLSRTTVTPRAIRRYFVDLGPTGIIVALISLADHLAMRGPELLTEHWQLHLATVHQLLQSYIRERESIIPPRLLQANELIQHLELQPGPIIGQLLESLAEAQADGVIQSKEDALWFAEEQLERIRRK